MNVYHLLAGIAALAVLVVHARVGGRLFVQPLLAEQRLNRVTRLTLYYCWHLVTLFIAAIAILYLVASTTQDQMVLAVTATALAAGASILNLLIVVGHRQRLWHMPQWLFFAIVAGLGATGIAW